MDTIYEYKFVRLGDYRVRRGSAPATKHATPTRTSCMRMRGTGWRLVQIFAPGVAAFGAAKYYELIFERERAEETGASTGTRRGRVGSPAGA
jgi:hypothetical protein